MPVYLCRWPNGDVSLAAGKSEVEVADVLDEVDNPDAAELMQLDAVAVHLKLGTRPSQEGTLPLRFEGMSEQLESSIYERAYPVYNEVRTKPDPTTASAGSRGERRTRWPCGVFCDWGWRRDRIIPRFCARDG
jgi:hypothetical protein